MSREAQFALGSSERLIHRQHHEDSETKVELERAESCHSEQRRDVHKEETPATGTETKVGV